MFNIFRGSIRRQVLKAVNEVISRKQKLHNIEVKSFAETKKTGLKNAYAEFKKTCETVIQTYKDRCEAARKLHVDSILSKIL